MTTVRSRHLGSALARVLRDSGQLAQDVAERMGWSASQFSRLLHGRARIAPADVATMLALCGVSSGGLRSTLLELAGDLMSPTWLQEYGERLPVEPAAVSELEESAARIVCVDGSAVPALLQAPGYMHAVLRFSPVVPADEIASRADAVVTRQRVLARIVRPPVVEAFVGAWVLSPNGFGKAVLAEQVEHLKQLSVEPTVRIRIVPEASPVCAPFQLMRFTEVAPVVYVEHLNSTLLTQRSSTIVGYERIVARLDERALSIDESRGFLAETCIALRTAI
jgi:transcriptional regulator with XRE-family HTH domain